MEVWNVTTGSSGANPLASAGDAHFFEDSIHPSTIRSYFVQSDPSNAAFTPNLTKGMKWLLASMSKGRDVSDFFPHVVKLTGASSLEVRKLVYMYLVHYADHDDTCRELALLSINSFQRGLADAEQLIRALALRALTSVRVSDIIQIQILGVQTCARDRSPYVRKCAANALSKLAPRCDVDQKQILLELLQKLLDEDVSTMVLSSAIIAFSELCPHELERLDGSYRKLCHLLTDVDEFGQVIMLDVLTRYCRKNFTNPGVGSAEVIDREKRYRRYGGDFAFQKGQNHFSTTTNATTSSSMQSGATVIPPHPRSIIQPVAIPTSTARRVIKKAFYSDEEDESVEEYDYSTPMPIFNAATSDLNSKSITATNFMDSTKDEDDHLDEDHRLLLRSSISLLKSRNSAVVLAVCSLHFYCGVSTIKTRSSIGKALVRIQRDRREISHVVLTCIKSLAASCPSAFTPFLSDFFVKAMDPSFTRQIKLDILTMLALDPDSISAVLQEFRAYIRHHDKAFVQLTIRSVGKIAEFAQIVHDKRGKELNSMEIERKKAATVALNCLYGVQTFVACSRNPKVLGECVLIIRHILVQLQSMTAFEDGQSATNYDVKFVDDPNQIQSIATRRLFLLVLQILAPMEVKAKLQKDFSKTDEGQDCNIDDSLLPPHAIAAAIWVVSEMYLVSERPIFVTPELSDSKVRDKARKEILCGLAKIFPDTEPVVRLQAIHLATKSILLVSESNRSEDQSLVQICNYILELGKHDTNPDVRDRARYESSVVQLVRDSPERLSWKSAKKIFLHPKLPKSSNLPIGDANSPQNEQLETFPFGTLSSLVGHRAGATFYPLPPWADRNTPSSRRDPSSQSSASKTLPSSANATSQVAPVSFYNESLSDGSDSSTSDIVSSSDSEDSSETEEDSSSEEETSDDHGSEEERKDTVAVIFDKQSARREESPDSEETDESNSSDSDDSDANSIEESDGSSNGAVGNLLALDVSTSKIDITPSLPSLAQGLEGLVMAPLVLDSSSWNGQEADVERDSCAWKRLVRHELGGGLEVSFRFLRGVCSAKEAKLLNLSEGSVVAQLKFENRRNDFGILRHIRIVQRNGGQGSPKKVAIPQEIATLAKNQVSIATVGMDFGKPTSDRDGCWVAKFDIKSDRGTNPVEIRQSLAEMLSPLSLKSANFDKLAAKFTGSYQKISFSFNIEPTLLNGLPTHIVKHANMAVVDSKLEFSAGLCRFGATLPFSRECVLMSLKCDSVSGASELVMYCDNALASTSIMDTLKRSISSYQ